jgi:hypothetical protein
MSNRARPVLDLRGARALLLLLLLLASLVLTGGCLPRKTLTREEVDGRAQEYFQRGMDQFQRGEFRPALESFRLAHAYDPAGANPSIAEMIDKTETRLRISPSGIQPAAPAAPAPAQPTVARPTPQPTASGGPPAAQPTSPPGPPAAAPTDKPAAGPSFKTYRSRLYPYALEIPDNWSVSPAVTTVAEAPADLIEAPNAGQGGAAITVVAHLLPDDVDRRAYVEAHIKLLRSQGVQAEEFGRRTVDGFEATLLRARFADQRGRQISTFAIFASEQVGWRLTLTAQAEESDRLQPLFQRLLDSFRVVAQQTLQ